MPALLLIAALTCATAAANQAPAPPTAPPAHSTVIARYVPERVFDTRRKSFADFEAMLADVARADVVIVGEHHDNPNTHRLEAAILQGLLRRRVPVIVSLEMFERDVQPVLDRYLAGGVTEEDFMARSRPWPRYATDYRALVEIAKAHGWPVVAANVPRRVAADVAKQGLGALDLLDPAERAYAARELDCPLDEYFDRFVAAMSTHPAPDADTRSEAGRRAASERWYHSQCLKDETMADSIASAVDARAGRPATIVHYTGAFHSDFGAGTTHRVRRRLPGRRVAVVSLIAVDDLDSVAPSDVDLERAEYLVYTVN